MGKTHNLIEQLKEFGLNPNCWFLRKMQYQNYWLIVHRTDQYLQLIGQTKKEKKWTTLEWLV